MSPVGKHKDPKARLEAMRRDLAHSLYPDQSRFHARKLCLAASLPIPAWAAQKPRPKPRSTFVRAPVATPVATLAVLEVPRELPEELRAWRARTRGSCVHISRSRGVILDVLGESSQRFDSVSDAIAAVAVQP